MPEITMDEALARDKKIQLEYLDPMVQLLPPLIARKQVELFLGGIVSRKTLANADHRGLGPELRIVFNDEVAYTTRSILKWLETTRKVRAIRVPRAAQGPRAQ